MNRRLAANLPLRLGITCASLIAVAALSAQAPASADRGSATRVSTSAVQDPALAAAISAATNLRASQLPGGTWPDPIAKAFPGRFRDSYGNAMTGAALIEIGHRSHRADLKAAGLKAIRIVLNAKPGRGAKADSDRQFTDIALADAWPYARADLTLAVNRPLGRIWLRRLREIRFSPTKPIASAAANAYANRRFLQDMLTLRICSLRLGGGRPGTIVASCRRRKEFVREIAGRSAAIQGASNRAALLADPPLSPLAYNSLSSAAMARSLASMSRSEARLIIPHLAACLRAASTLQAPDGDIAWAGRSSEHPWALAGAAFAARSWNRAAKLNGPDSALARRIDSLSLERITSVHLSNASGFFLTPAVAVTDDRMAAADMDVYASQSAYSGLTLLFTAWASEAPAAGTATARPPGSNVIRGAGPVDTASAASPSAWAGISGGSASSSDHRRSPGLLRLKTASAGGLWTDVISGVPRLSGRAGASDPGPTYWRAGRLEHAFHARLSAFRAGGVAMRFDLGLSGRAIDKRGLIAVYRPIECGLTVSLPAVPGADPRLAVNVEGPVSISGGIATWSTGALDAGPRVTPVEKADRGTSLSPATRRVIAVGSHGRAMTVTLRGRDCG